MYDTRELATQRERLWPASPRETVGIDWRADAQLELCRTVFSAQDNFEFIDEPSDDQTEYHAGNDQYPPLDAWVLSGILEHARPARMIEIGSGFSTLIAARTNRERLGARCSSRASSRIRASSSSTASRVSRGCARRRSRRRRSPCSKS